MSGSVTRQPDGMQPDRALTGWNADDVLGLQSLETFRWFDMHMHAGFVRDRQALAAQTQEAGLFLYSTSVSLNDFLESRMAYEAWPQVQVGLGLHPWWIAAGVAPSQMAKPGLLVAVPPGWIAGAIAEDRAQIADVDQNWISGETRGLPASVDLEEIERQLVEVLGDLKREHPDARSFAPSFKEALILADLAKSWPLIGEIGIDTWPRTLAQAPLWVQRKVFSIICSTAAIGAHLLSIHASGKEAATACMDVLEETGCTENPEATIIFHWFSGSSAELARARKLGCWFSIGVHGLEMRKRRSYARETGSRHLLLETDLPEDLGDELTADEIIDQLEQAATILSQALGQDMVATLRTNSTQVLIALTGKMKQLRQLRKL